MFARQDEPIVAIATAPGRGAVGMVRVSGRGLAPLIEAVCGKALAPRVATYLPFKAGDGSTLDQGLAIYFPAPHSYTGEDVLELQAHGGPVVLQLLLARCLEAAATTLPGLRLAQPGEFTERAFHNDKIDLAQAEAIADLIDASTEAAARSATRAMVGEFSRDIHALRDALIHLRMLVEATLDFPEEDIDFLAKADAVGQLSKIEQQLATVMRNARQGALLREGIKVVIAGQPNAGKSSLLNALAGAELAIVTPIAGTTRDKVTQTIQIEGVPLHIIDTAGLRESADEVEKIGIERAWQEIAQADAVLFMHDLTRLNTPDYQAADAAIAQQLARELSTRVPVIEVYNKCDLVGASDARGADATTDKIDNSKLDKTHTNTQGHKQSNVVNHDTETTPKISVHLSAKQGTGLDELRHCLLKIAGWQSASEGVYMARERHVQALHQVKAHLAQAHALLHARQPALDLLAEELRLAQEALNTITGEFTSDDLLGVIFSKFCIGK